MEERRRSPRYATGAGEFALLPVAGWGPRVPAGHLDPLRAAQALVRLQPRAAVPIHWGTYRRVGLDRDAIAPIALVMALEQRPGRLAVESYVDLLLPPLECGEAQIGRAGDDPPAGGTGEQV